MENGVRGRGNWEKETNKQQDKKPPNSVPETGLQRKKLRRW